MLQPGKQKDQEETLVRVTAKKHPTKRMRFNLKITEYYIFSILSYYTKRVPV